MKNNNRNNFDLGSFCMGGLVSVLICIGIYVFALRPNTAGDKVAENNEVLTTEDSTEDSDTSAVIYNTGIKEFTVNLESGEEVTFHTPENAYSLTDQYLENLSSYYGMDSVNSDSMIVVGDADTTYASNIMLNCDILSDVTNMLSQLYGDEFDPDSVVDSEAYTYMTTGELPEELPDNYTIEEVANYTVDGIDYVAYEVNYDVTYVLDSDEESTESSETVVHTQEIACYSKTGDAVEIIIYQDEFNREDALSFLEEFLGVE